MDRALRAQVLMAEAAELGVTIDDLVRPAAMLEVRTAPVSVAEFVGVIAPAFTPATAATYDTYWRLATARFGDRRVGEITVEDCVAVVAEAERRARASRSSSDGRSSRENCVAALRALFTRAQLAGLAGGNPAAAIPKPRRRRSQRRPLERRESAELIEAVRTTRYLIVEAVDDGDESITDEGIDAVRLVVGAAFFLLAWLSWRKRPGPGETAREMRMLDRIRRISPLGALGFGLLQGVVVVENIPLGLAGGAHLGEADLGGGEAVQGTALFGLLASVGLILLVLASVVGGARFDRPMVSFREWMCSSVRDSPCSTDRAGTTACS